MEIIKRGTKNQATCSNCESVLAFNSADLNLRKLPDSQRDFDSGDEEDQVGTYIICAVCKKPVTVCVSFSERSALIAAEKRRDNDI